MPPDFSLPRTVIITLNWNGGSNTVKLLSSFVDADLSFPIWVVDNGSAIDQTEDFQKTNPMVTVVRLDQNYGFAGGLNRAIQMALDSGFDFVYEINNDCIVSDDVVTPCLKIAGLRPEAAIIGSRYLSKDCEGNFTQWGFHSDPSAFEHYDQGFLPTDRVVGCGMLIKCSAVIDAGGFDERFFCYGEETDACWRLRSRGHSVGMCDGSLVLHDHQGSDTGNNAIYYRTRNNFLQYRKHPKQCTFFHREFKNAVVSAWSCLFHAQTQKALSYTQGLLHGIIRRYGKRPPPLRSKLWLSLLLFFTILMPPVFLAYQARKSKAKLCRSKTRFHVEIHNRPV